MELNYLGRYRSLISFYNLINTSAKVLSNVIVGRLTDSWGSSIPPFDPSVSYLGPADARDGIALGSITVGGQSANVVATVTAKLIAGVAPNTSNPNYQYVTYNGATYYALDVTLANATTRTDPNNNRFLTLFVQINLKVTAGREFTFRQIGFRDANIPSEANQVFAYENINPQTVGSGEGLTMKLALAF